MKKQQLKLALNQLIGFAHASAGYSIRHLAESMGMTKSEWEQLKNINIGLKKTDIDDLNELFKSTSK